MKSISHQDVILVMLLIAAVSLLTPYDPLQAKEGKYDTLRFWCVNGTAYVTIQGTTLPHYNTNGTIKACVGGTRELKGKY